MMKHFTNTLFAGAAAVLLAGSSASAELVWESKEVHLKASPLDKVVVARYPFRNDGTEVVKFKSFKSACGCIEITATTMAVQPGGKGEVTVKFTPEFRIGDQKRPIAVQFDDAKQSRMALYLRVEIPEIVRPQPIFLRWGPEEALEAKAVTIVTDEQYPVESVSVRTTNPLWVTTVTPTENSRNYTLQVLPKRRVSQAQYVEVEAKLADGQVKRTNVYVVVR